VTVTTTKKRDHDHDHDRDRDRDPATDTRALCWVCAGKLGDGHCDGHGHGVFLLATHPTGNEEPISALFHVKEGWDGFFIFLYNMLLK
jgi:hypothetical protein